MSDRCEDFQTTNESKTLDVSLSTVESLSSEEEEIEVHNMRAILYRYDSSTRPAEWKERGRGDIKVIQNRERTTFRMAVTKDHINPAMEMVPLDGSWRWYDPTDFPNEVSKSKILGVRFPDQVNEKLFKSSFDKTQSMLMDPQDSLLQQYRSEEDVYEITVSVIKDPEDELISENDKVLFNAWCMLFKYDASNQWYEELGSGQVAILDCKRANAIRLLMVDDASQRVCTDFFFTPSIPLEKKAGTPRELVWSLPQDSCPYSADRNTFLVRFGTPDTANAFQEHFELAKMAMTIRAAQKVISLFDNVEDQEDRTL